MVTRRPAEAYPQRDQRDAAAHKTGSVVLCDHALPLTGSYDCRIQHQWVGRCLGSSIDGSQTRDVVVALWHLYRFECWCGAANADAV